MNYEHIRCDLDGTLMIVTLSRPDKLNAYTGQMGAEITHAFNRADNDDNVRAIIVTGAGRAFCAGADVSGGAASFDTSGKHGAGVFASANPGGGRFVEAIFNCRKPSIAAINGGAVGVGITMTLPMDIRIAAKGAKIGFIFARRGLVPEAGSAWFLPKLVGLPQALRWCLSGRTFDADEARDGGLVSEVVEPAQLLDRAKEIAREMTEATSAELRVQHHPITMHKALKDSSFYSFGRIIRSDCAPYNPAKSALYLGTKLGTKGKGNGGQSHGAEGRDGKAG